MEIVTFIPQNGGPARQFEQGARLESLINRAVVQAAAMGVGPQGAMTRYRQDENTRRIDSIGQARGIVRRDSFSPTLGFHVARQLEQRYSDILREEFPQKTALTLFTVDQSIQPGAREHTVTRIYGAGEVAEYRAGTDIPRVSMGTLEESFPVRHYVTSFVLDLFDNLSSGFANTNLAGELLRTARDLMMEFYNIRTWWGSSSSGMFGVVTYPWLLKKIMTSVMTTATATTDVLKDAVANEVLDLWDTPADNSFSTFSPDTMAVSGRLIRTWQKLRYADGSGETVYERIAKVVGESNIMEANELQATGPGGTDGILCYRRDRFGIQNTLVQPITTLPTQTFGFEDRTFCYMSHGGIIMRNVANNVLGWATAA